MPTHTVKQGDHISSIAEKYRFFDYHTIWDDPNNAALKQKRKNPNVLFPGDELFIPDKQYKKVARNTGASHRFKIKGQTVMLRLVLRDLNSEPITGMPCKLEVEGKVYQLTTNGNGMIEQLIPKTAESGNLSFSNFVIPLKIGHLDPPEEISGWRARLNNLGYNAGKSEDSNDRLFKSAIEEFQIDYSLKVDGVCGPQTQAKLKEIHGC
jgi:peptidoglycan hydrolase-like protein with peptidoglycan-binding domain